MTRDSIIERCLDCDARVCNCRIPYARIMSQLQLRLGVADRLLERRARAWARWEYTRDQRAFSWLVGWDAAYNAYLLSHKLLTYSVAQRKDGGL